MPAERAYSETLNNGIPLTLRFRSVKLFRITVKPDGSVEAVAPRRMGVGAAMALANERGEWVRAHREAALARRAALLALYRRELERGLPALVEKYAAALGVPAPQWSLRDMRTRWGSCTPARGTVRFALMLAAKPPLCLEYVVAHELAHLRVHGHGPEFHALVAGVFPREREARAMLR